MQEIKKEEVSWQEKYKLRHDSNLKILKCLELLINKFPDWRFFQIMTNLGFDTKPDRFYEESYDTAQQIEAMTDYITKSKQQKKTNL